jgi:hypothetical protein
MSVPPRAHRRLVREQQLRERRRDDDHELVVREEACGCMRLRCTHSHSPAEILEALDAGWTVDDLLCGEDRRAS